MILVILSIIAMAITAGIGVFLFGYLIAMMYLGIFKGSENGTDGRTGVEDSGMAAGTQQQDAQK